MNGVDVIAKLHRLNDHLAELNTGDRQFVTDMLNGERLLIPEILRLVHMMVPGETPPLDPLLRDEMVSVERQHLDNVIWQYMPLEKFFALLSTNKLHFSPLSSMPDPSEGVLPKAALDASEAQLPECFRNGSAGLSAGDVTAELQWHRKQTVSISCWYMSESDSREMWRDYAPRNGVAIRTTVQRLFSSLRKINDTNIHLSQATYFSSDEEDEYAKQAFFGNLYIKRAEPFQKERELRALAPNGAYRYGVDIPVTLPVLIERLVLSPELPEWAVSSFTETMRKLGVECPIEKSLAV